MRKREGGAAAVEFALVLPMLLLVIAGIVDFGRAMFTQNVMTNAAREGARLASMGYTVTEVTTRVDQAMAAAAGSGYTTQVQYLNGPAAPATSVPCPASPTIDQRQRVVITMTGFDYLMLDFIPGASQVAPDLRASAEMRCGG